MLLLGQAIVFASLNAYAEDKKVNLSVPHTMNLLIDFDYCKKSLKKSQGEVEVLDTIVQKEQVKADALTVKNANCTEDYDIKKTQAEEWKKEYAKCAKELGECDELPWWKIDFKSAGAGILLTLLLIVGI